MDLLTVLLLSGGGLGGNQQAMNMMFMQNINSLQASVNQCSSDIQGLRQDFTTLNGSVEAMAQSLNNAAAAVSSAVSGQQYCASSGTIPAARVRVTP